MIWTQFIHNALKGQLCSYIKTSPALDCLFLSPFCIKRLPHIPHFEQALSTINWTSKNWHAVHRSSCNRIENSLMHRNQKRRPHHQSDKQLYTPLQSLRGARAMCQQVCYTFRCGHSALGGGRRCVRMQENGHGRPPSIMCVDWHIHDERHDSLYCGGHVCLRWGAERIAVTQSAMREMAGIIRHLDRRYYARFA